MTIVVPPTLSVLVSIWMETLVYGWFFIVYPLLDPNNTLHNRRNQCSGIFRMPLCVFIEESAPGQQSTEGSCGGVYPTGYVLPPTKEAMTKYLLDITVPSDVAKQILLVLVNLFSDIIITWRVHVVWMGRWYITIIPICLCLGVFTCGMATAILITISKPGQSIFLERISTWGTASISLTLIMNVSATILIISGIWWSTKSIRELAQESNRMDTTWAHRNKYYWRLMVVLVESAAAAAIAQTIELVFYVTKFPGVYFVADTVVQIAAISPLVMIAFIGLSTKRGGSWTETTTSYFQPSNEGYFEGVKERKLTNLPDSSTKGKTYDESANGSRTLRGEDIIEFGDMDGSAEEITNLNASHHGSECGSSSQ
ncbi:hypothetical protein AMATHDRAFT_50533 [Amanita thiersii Skay4041]|uniref:Uncharacterized protein n=1 Tax=Amanita thiersii Skay4041 TaxID=703135 RepID=A0A2A9NAL8_9AGAR|nr:hypothetical protein AMATHDRAFT_50533 [Amanita thiersii Skay4041]